MSRGLRNGLGLAGADAARGPACGAVDSPGKTMARLLHTVPAEVQPAFEADGPASDWADVKAAETRFYIGAKSPDYYPPMAQQLVRAMPNASLEVIPRLGHDALARAGAKLVASLARFLA